MQTKKLVEPTSNPQSAWQMSKREAKKLSSSKKAKKAFSVVSLFSGYGGLDLGFAGGFAYRKWAFDKNLFQMVFANNIIGSR